MDLVFHGGKCCGIKTIFGFQMPPGYAIEALKKKGIDNSDTFGNHVGSNKRFFHEAAPEETYLQRLDRYLEYCDRRRPQGIIEVVLAQKTATHGWMDQPAMWEKHLLERGFQIVNSCLNSNSHNRIFVYHRNSGEVPKATLPQTEEQPQPHPVQSPF